MSSKSTPDGRGAAARAEFKAFEKYLKAEGTGWKTVEDVPAGGHSQAWVFKSYVGWDTKAACPNCEEWLTKLDWTTGQGSY